VTIRNALGALFFFSGKNLPRESASGLTMEKICPLA
jgi:hypothetical protein